MNEVVRLDDGRRLTGEVLRVDFSLGRIGKLERTPTGGVRVPARGGRTGVLTYQTTDGRTIREYRPPEEAFDAESLASLDDAIVTVGHPECGMVTPDTVKRDGVGYVRGPGVREKSADGEFIGASLAVVDGSAIARIDSGELVEISSGYKCVHDVTPGKSPEGEEYDVIQRRVRYNHVALLAAGEGRAGSDVALRLDGREAIVRLDSKDLSSRSGEMEETIDGKKYTVGTPDWLTAHTKRLARLDAAVEEAEEGEEEAEKKLTDAIKVRDGLQAQLDAANASIAALKKDMDGEKDESKMDAKIAARLALLETAKRVLPEAKFDGKTGDAIRREVLIKLDGAACVEGKDAGYVEIYFGGRLKALGEQQLGDARGNASPLPKLDQVDAASDAKTKFENAWKTKR